MTHAHDMPRLEMRWLPVSDAQGRTRLEAHWIEVGRPASAPASATAA